MIPYIHRYRNCRHFYEYPLFWITITTTICILLTLIFVYYYGQSCGVRSETLSGHIPPFGSVRMTPLEGTPEVQQVSKAGSIPASSAHQYNKGFNDALDTIMLLDLELKLTGERKTWGEMMDICRKRFNIPNPRDSAQDIHTYTQVYTDKEIAQAIWHAEGAEKTRFQYGIKWVGNREIKPDELSVSEARQICLNSIRNARGRWDGQGGFIEAMGLRYSPPKENPHWVKNVKWFLRSDS